MTKRLASLFAVAGLCAVLPACAALTDADKAALAADAREVYADNRDDIKAAASAAVKAGAEKLREGVEK